MAQERFIQLSLQRKMDNGRFAIITTRSYVHAQNATMKAVELLMFGGEPGDVVEVAHVGTGNQFGTVKISASGKLSIDVDYHHPMLLAHQVEIQQTLRSHQEQTRRRLSGDKF